MSGSEYSSFVGVQYLICECGDAFQNEELLRAHLEQKHPKKQQLKASVRRLRKVPPPITEYKCGECGNIYATEEECVAHQEIDHIPFMKEELVYQDDIGQFEDVEEVVIPDLIVASTSHNSSPAPPVINSSPIRVQSLPNTFVTLSNSVPSIPNPAASVPNPAASIPKPVKRRQKKVKPPKEPTEGEDGEDKPKPKRKNTYKYRSVQCETCGKSYGSRAAMRYHQRVHTGDRPYKCEYCPKAFTMALFLQVHTRIHTGEKPYKCNLCQKSFTNKAALQRHDRVHTGVKPYQCPKCFKSFTQSNSLKLHFHTVHLKMPTPYKSSRRRAEMMDKVERKGKGGIDSQALIKAVMEGPEQYYEISTPAGRKISLTPIVPRKVQEQFPPPTITEDGSVVYYGVKDEPEEEELTYEVIYE